MSLAKRVESALTLCRGQKSFLQELLHGTLDWPIKDIRDIEEIAYSWSAEDLKAAGHLDPHLVEGSAWQIQPLERDQPWGIFVLQFKNPDALTSGRGMAGVLRSTTAIAGSATRKRWQP